jgi:hypothetical protein
MQRHPSQSAIIVMAAGAAEHVLEVDLIDRPQHDGWGI